MRINSAKPEPRSAGRSRLGLALGWFLALTAGTSCVSTQTQTPVDLSGPGWTVREGQAVWQAAPAAPGVAGDLLVATHPDGSSLIQFIKPPLPFVIAQQTSNSWQIQFFAQKKTYSGRRRPPSRILWLQLMDALAGRPTLSIALKRAPEGRWRLENTNTHEVLDGFLTTTRLPATHLVRTGETLAQLAYWYGVSTDAIEEANLGSVSQWFKPGNRISLPTPGHQRP